MQRLKIIQQRVFCIFMRPYQRSTGKNAKNQIVTKLSEATFEELAWWDPSECPACPVCPSTGGCPDCPTCKRPASLRPLGPSDLISTSGSGLAAITDPASTKLLERQEEALQYYNYIQNPSNPKVIKSYVETDSRALQPFNEDRMYTEDLWFLHSTWTSFEKAKLVVRPLVDVFGFDSIMMTSYIPLDMELLPNK